MKVHIVRYSILGLLSRKTVVIFRAHNDVEIQNKKDEGWKATIIKSFDVESYSSLDGTYNEAKWLASTLDEAAERFSNF